MSRYHVNGNQTTVWINVLVSGYIHKEIKKLAKEYSMPIYELCNRLLKQAIEEGVNL